jgi:hypothetical protein
MAELALDHDQRDSLARHLNRVRVPQLMECEPATESGGNRGVVKLFTDADRGARPAACRPTHDAE